jgi:hypothetical protein
LSIRRGKAAEPSPTLAAVRQPLGRDNEGDRHFVELLMAAREHGLDAVETACRQALAAGLRTSAAILNIMARNRQPLYEFTA